MEKPREQYVLKAITNPWTEEEGGRQIRCHSLRATTMETRIFDGK